MCEQPHDIRLKAAIHGFLFAAIFASGISALLLIMMASEIKLSNREMGIGMSVTTAISGFFGALFGFCFPNKCQPYSEDQNQNPAPVLTIENDLRPIN